MPASTTRVAGGLVIAFASLYIRSLQTHTNTSRPSQHTLLVIAGSIVVVPYVFLTSPSWYGFPMKLTVCTLTLLLDWFSFHEDKTRFSEEKICLTGSCRRNAMITGHLAHWGDVAGLAFLLIGADRKSWPVIVAGLVTYGIVGSRFINRMTTDGSPSDLRGRTESTQCAHARIMRDGWRGTLNDLITFLGVAAAWQSLFTCGDGRCTGPMAPLKVVRSVVTDEFRDAVSRREKSLSAMRVVVSLLTTVIPTYSNYINTTAQHGQLFAELYKLPSCFDG